MQNIRPAASSISLAQVFPLEAIVVGLETCTRSGVIFELIRRLVTLGHLAEQEEKSLIARILAREKLGTTALGNGIAMPHCRSSSATRYIGALALEPRGIPFDAIDGQPVHAVFLVLAPPDGREHYYEILGNITAIARDKTRRLHLRGCRTPEMAHRYLQELDTL
jgi:mannitol/fructose-specific phosphotransferase system IIA component (Ntr-type)